MLPHARLGLAGTKSFCAPEIIACEDDEGYYGPPSDLWSAGICWFALLCGRLPFVIADEIADWRFAKVAAAQTNARSSCAEILSWTDQVRQWHPTPSNWLALRCQANFARVIVRISCRQAVPWGEPVQKMVDSLLSADPVRRPTAAQAVKTGWLHFHAVRRTGGPPLQTATTHPTAALTEAPAQAPAQPVASAHGQAGGNGRMLTRSRSIEASLDAAGLHSAATATGASGRQRSTEHLVGGRQRSEQGHSIGTRQRSEQSLGARQRSEHGPTVGMRQRSLDGLALPPDGPPPQMGTHLRPTVV